MEMGRFRVPDGLRQLVDWLGAAPSGTSVPAAALVDLLTPLLATRPTVVQDTPQALSTSWRERLWVVPPETRLGVGDVAESVGRPKSWVYRRTGKLGSKAPLPHRRLDGELVFVAGEIRTWLAQHETVMAEPVHGLARGLPSVGSPDHCKLKERKMSAKLREGGHHGIA